MQSKHLLMVVAIVGVIAAGFILLFVKTTDKGEPRPDMSPGPATVSSPTPADAIKPEASSPGPGDAKMKDEAARHHLQSRLNAIAQAYNDGNAKAIELALWKNHAVVRPNGEHLDRAGVLQKWAKEWTELHNRELALTVLSFEREDDYVSASWSLELAADVIDEFEETHKFEMHGLQEARYLISGDEELLDGPITYTIVDQTMNGEPWPIQ